MSKICPRFRGIHQLLGDEAFARLSRASICVVGLGGVGSWSVEALARSGVGAITLVDLDEVCVTNINRQIHALTNSIGLSKVELLAERIGAINPDCTVTCIRRFFTESSAEKILSVNFTAVLDTIDNNSHKATLIGECVKRGIPVVTVGSAGDRTDARALTVIDLAKTIHDPLLQIVRKQLRDRYNFPKGERAKFKVPCVYIPKQRGARDTSCSTGSGVRKSCNDGLGSAVYVTGALGFAAAEEVVRIVIS